MELENGKSFNDCITQQLCETHPSLQWVDLLAGRHTTDDEQFSDRRVGQVFLELLQLDDGLLGKLPWRLDKKQTSCDDYKQQQLISSRVSSSSAFEHGYGSTSDLMVSSARTHTYIAFLKRGRTVQRALGTMILCGIGSLQNQYVPVHHAFKRYNKGWLLLGFLFCFFVVALFFVCLFVFV